ncbi:DUF2637 domain-containing protein [Rothia kristinae]|uniref:DUF2637 domain-containing protein n=1 Tax=Rothia kristinae TaxID=37923 RepID=UPI0022E7094E|nr:DUF2637 domain-containing protein [Rothia kristinae]
MNTTRTVTGSAGRRINPDSLRTLWFTVALVGVLGLTSFMVSFNGLHDVAAWVGLPWWMRWAVPIFIDIAILAYSMAGVIHRARGEATWPTWLTLGVFTGVSVVANAAHALAKGEGETSVQSWIGAAIAALAPLAVFAATEQISRLAFAVTAPGQEPVGSGVRVEVLRDDRRRAELPDTTSEAAPEAASASDRQELTATPVVERQKAPEATTREASAPADETSATAEDAVPGAAAAEAETASAPAAPEPRDRPVAAAEEASQAAAEEPESPAEPAAEAPVAGTWQVIETPEATAEEPAEAAGKPREADGAEELDEFAAWVRKTISAGETVTGAMAGQFLGKSDRTGRNRLNALREEHPEIFEDEEK